MAGKVSKRTRAKGNGQIGLTKETITDAAIRLIDEKGAAGFSMRDLARSLGVYPATLYWHVHGNKDDFLAEVAARVMGDFVTAPGATRSWQASIRDLFHRYRRAMHEHPNVAPLIGAQLVSNGVSSAPLVEKILGALVEAGFSGEALVDAYNATLAGLVGFATLELAPGPANDGAWQDRFREQLARIDAERFPLLHANMGRMANRAFIVRWQSGSEVPLDGGFTTYVDAIVDGLEARAARLKSA